MQYVFRKLGTAQDEAHLGAIAVGDNHIPAFFNHVHNMRHGVFGCFELILYGFVIFIFD
jgi:hypothetical protein